MTLDKYLTIAECLPQEQEPCEDAISKHDEDKTELVSKQDVVKLIDEWNAISFYEANEHSKECYYEIRNAIISMQPVASCFDAISRQAVLDIVNNPLNIRLDEIIKKLPPVNLQEPKWIPVSERMPEESDEYIVCVIDPNEKGYKHTGVAWFADAKDYEIEKSEWRELMHDEEVIAWMPLPEPYKEREVSDETDN